MRKVILLFLGFLTLPIFLHAQDNGGYIRAGTMLQSWNIENINDAVFEATFPIEVSYPLRENIQFQINHSPAVSRFGEIGITGLSDTWLKTNYFITDNAVASIGLGLPTGKTKLDSTKLILAKLLSWQSFQFYMPVFGQGLTLSGGMLYAYPFTDKLSAGAGINFVYRAKYNYSDAFASEIDPGEQIGLNIGIDYLILENLRSTFDFVFNYFTPDKIKGVEIFASGPQFLTLVSLQYRRENQTYWLSAKYQAKAKNQIYDYLTESLKTEKKNSNITIREISFGVKFQVSNKVSISVVAEARSYVENEFRHGWTDIGGGGVVGEYLLSEQLSLYSGVKLFYGDGEIFGHNPSYQGYEFMLGTEWKF